MEIIVGKYTLESLTTGMYSNPRDIYREYIQNSVDSIDNAIKANIIQAQSARINITIEKENRRIIFEDNGAGVSSDIAPALLTSVGNSNKSISSNRGFRGIGRLSGLSYCKRLIFETSCAGEAQKTIVEFDAEKLKRLLVPGEFQEYDMSMVISEVTSFEFSPETEKRHYFKVTLESVDPIEGLLEFDSIVHFLSQTAPVMYNTKNFSWSRKIHKAIKRHVDSNEEYFINVLSNDEDVQIFKSYSDRFVSDKFKRIADEISDIEIVEIYDQQSKEILAVVWYSLCNFFGSILDERKKGIRFRKGNILVGDGTSLNSIFKESRFNGWFQGEVVVLSSKIIPNTRRDGFEKNTEYLYLVSELEKLGSELSKKIRSASAARNVSNYVASNKPDAKLKSSKTAYMELSDETDEMEINLKNISFENDHNLSLFKSLNELVNENNGVTKYKILNIVKKLSKEQKHLLEKVFDAISDCCDSELASRCFSEIVQRI